MAGVATLALWALTIGTFLSSTGAAMTETQVSINLTTESPSTIITSQNYPQHYPTLFVDTWLVVSPPETVISVQVLDFQVEMHQLAKDILYIGNGLNYTTEETSYTLPRDIPKGTAEEILKMISSGPAVWLQFKSDHGPDNQRGFELQLTAIDREAASCDQHEYVCNEVILVCMQETVACDGPPQCSDKSDETFCEHCGESSIDLSDVVSHTVTSPKHPEDFPYEILCHWLVNASNASSILLSFVKFNLEESTDLFSVGIGYDPINITSALFRRRGSVTPLNMVVKSNQIWLAFKTMGNIDDESLMHVKLEEFEPVVCEDGYFSCDSGLECIQQTAVCNGLPDCSDHSDELNCETCSTQDSTDVHTSCSCFQESYICNGAKECDDFYDELHCAPCGAPFIELTDDTSPFNLTSPYYPSTYPRELACLWLITAQPNHRILLHFTDFKLNVETLSLGNGHHPSNASSLILRRSGATTPIAITTEGPEMWITFETLTTNQESLFRGYSLEIRQFIMVECGTDQFGCVSGHQCVADSDRCDGVADCLDFSDEIGCASCNSDQFTCMNDVCVEHEGICNGLVDCADFKDETGCGTLCGERNIALTSEVPAYKLISPDLVTLEEKSSAYPPGYSCLWTLSTDPELQIALKVLYISVKGRPGDALRIGNGYDPSDVSSVIAVIEGVNDKQFVGRTFLSSDSEMWIAMEAASIDKYAPWGAFDLEITRHNVSGECVNGSRCSYDSICVPDTAWCDGVSNCNDYSDEQSCDHCGGETTGVINVTDAGAPYLLTARLTNEISPFYLGKDCLWVIMARPGSRIQLTFLYLILISDSFYWNIIKIGNGQNPANGSSEFLARTGKTVREIVTSSGSEMWIVVETYRLQVEEGFSALLNEYEPKECLAHQYTCSSGLKCIEESQRCDGLPDCPDVSDEFGCADCSPDQLRCGGGMCVDEDRICDGKADCPDKLDERICAPCGNTVIDLRSDPDGSTILSSPSYSIAPYPSDMSCTWLLTALDDHFIQLEFIDFKTEANYDKLSAGNGHDSQNVSSVILSGISGDEAPRIIVSDEHLMWITFTADQMVRDRGFQLSITQLNTTVECDEAESSCSSGAGLVCLRHESKCNGIAMCPDGSDEEACGICGSNTIYVYGADTHNLTSPGFPATYPANQPCSWRIQTSEKPSGMSGDESSSGSAHLWRLLAHIELFDLENQYDFLTLYDWDRDEGITGLIANLTGKTKLTTVVSSGTAMFIKFTSDNTGSGKGFKIRLQPDNRTSDFCKEPDFTCKGNHFCVTGDAECNGFNDCLNFYDEQDCGEVNCPDDYMCENEIVTDDDLLAYECITVDLVCNGRTDCPEHDDEMQCDTKKCPEDCNCYYDNKGLVIKCLGTWGQNTVDYMAKTVKTLSLNGGNVTVLRQGTFKGMKSLHTLSLSENNILAIEARTFDGLDRLSWLELSENYITELESYSFQELSSLEGLTLWNVPLQRVKDYAFTGLTRLQKLAIIRGVLDSPMEVDPQGFDGLDNLQTLYVDDHRLCCFFRDVTCTSLEPRPPLFMCSNLMPNTALRVFMWILGISALVGNFGVMLWRFREKNSKASRQVHSFLVFNLAVSDFFMGVYMVMIAAADVHYGDQYFMYASEWRSTVTCKIASTLSVVSSEASVFIVTIITVDRFLCIVFPFSQLHLRRHSSRVILFIVWCLAIAVSVIPTLLADEESSFYGLSDVCIGLPLQTRATDFASTTQDIGSPFSNETFDIPVALSYEPSWVFSIVLFLGVNLVCFLVILVCYVVIFIHVQLSLKQVNRHMHRYEEIKMAAKMALIVGTDLLCWLPIIIMGILAQSGVVSIPVEMYAWTVVFILPINSSLNPYLYTISSCAADRRRENLSTVNTRHNGTMPMTNRANFDKSMHSKEVSVVD